MNTTSQSGVSQEAALAQALDGLWQRFLPQIRERVAILESAAAARAAGPLTEELREAALTAAHKLAGTLGTFGLARGTVLARELESAFTCESSPGSDTNANPAEDPAESIAELRELIENRKPSA
jgi:HPt (histidine-containing phosphotransfer) domain-containing protein